MKKRRLLLIVLDGWGLRSETKNNAIAMAKTPHWDAIWETYPHTELSCSGEQVGLPPGQMGNSEVGHMHIGAGRIIPQDLTRIDQAIADGHFHSLPLIQELLTTSRTVHVMGLLSPGGVHSSEKHILTLLETLLKAQVNCCLHPFLDGRDTPPQSARDSLAKAQALIDQHPTHGKIATLIGRYFAMDRDKRWERTAAAYHCIAHGQGHYQADSALAALNAAYDRNEQDEFIQATTIDNYQGIAPGDIICFMNFRSDRARQLTRAFIEPVFSHFDRGTDPEVSRFISLTQISRDLKTQILFPPSQPKNCLGEVFAKAGLTQLRIAETEKYGHVTFFFNGGREEAFPGEERILIPSPKVATYDLKPEMSAKTVTNALKHAIASKHYDVMICNYANADMVGHCGNQEATIKAIETIDDCLGELVSTATTHDCEILITADHGNAEQTYDEDSQQTHTAHTNNPVPLIYIGRPASFSQDGSLIDIAPTMLSLLEQPIPSEMTGKNILKLTTS